jgi:ABC-type glycerol-3-phosphate transport system substrate-binding protein
MKKGWFVCAVAAVVLLAAAVPVFAAPVKVVLWSSLTGAKAKAFDAQVARYNGSQQDVAMDVVHQGNYSALREKVVAAVSANNLPAMLVVDYLDVAFYAQQGLLKDLDGVLPRAVADDYYPSLLADLKYQGKLYGVPYNRSTQGNYLNMDVLRKAGIQAPPKTWVEFRSQAEQFGKAMGKGFYYGYAFFHQFLWDGIAYTWGAQVSTPDGKVLLNAPEVVDMMTYFRKMYTDELLAVQPVLIGGFEEQNGAFISGKVASVFQTTSFTPTAVGLLKFDWQFAPLPAGKGGNAITMGGGNFAITSRAADPAAAAKFLQFITGPQVAAEFYMQTGNLPVRKSVLALPEIADFHKKNPNYGRMLDQMAFGKAAPSTTKNVRDIFNRMNDVISRIILKGDDAKKTLDAATREFQAEVDELKASRQFLF